MLEEEWLVQGVKLKYMFKPRKYDNQHLLVIFSGFGGKDEFTYDFSNSLKDCPSNILWIKDDFEGHCCYYLCKDMNFNIENAVYEFIKLKLKELGLDKSQCTLAGFSKGGSASLYFGIKYDFKSIVSTVPQFHIGSYVYKGWKHIASHMLNKVDDTNIEFLDKLLPDALKNDNSYNKNIYLLTSESDSQYIPEIKPYLGEFIKYKNFNLFISKSKLVREHKNVTAHHVPLLISLFYSLAQGVFPHYGYAELHGDNTGKPSCPSGEPLIVLKKIKIDGDLFFPEGVCILQGLECPEYSDISHKLTCDGSMGSFEWNLAKDHMPRLTRDLYKDGFVNYDKGWFCSYRYKGFDISHILGGEYVFYITVTCQGITRTASVSVDSKMDNMVLASSKDVKIISKDGMVYLIKE